MLHTVEAAGLAGKILGKFVGKENIKIRDLDTVEKKILTLIADGSKSLQIITDFDQTITKYHQNGEKCDSSYCIFRNSDTFPEECKTELSIHNQKYWPIEINHDMTVEERIPYMLEWQNEFIKVLMKAGVNKDFIPRAINSSKIYVRDNAVKVFEKLNELSVPVLVFSAGIEDVVRATLQKNIALFPNMRIVSNKLEFDKDEFVVGIRPPSIHTFNKNQSVLGEHSDYFKELTHRPNAVLLGDNIGDVHMADGMKANVILKIGFLEEKVDAQLDSYMSEYDIVILDDQSWNIFHEILQPILLSNS